MNPSIGRGQNILIADGEDSTTLLLCMGEALSKFEKEATDAQYEIFQLLLREV
ncbi:hypothetical protein PPTG_24580 [Phytophthora nicotianae INRA-310]|uniref:Uncharacterized protein n=1 Tax=Phytophthora nicotianae (strain INRA-310) TaxID=761204 RepID=W2PF42_PHYN3|nr:hypothetical protein PPTG_24580 [Phytophthora nicotianae INRA-310]ETM98629.1 hypothetical protein PPTG_24580 [Phytophthora nicotianae INRA-310]